MSVPDEGRARRFLEPMKGALTVFLLHDTMSRERLGRWLLGCAAALSLYTTVLDTDAYFSANMDVLVGDARCPTGLVATLPEGDLEVESLVTLLTSRTAMLLLDDLNSLYSLAPEGQSARRLGAFVRMVAYNARVNGSWAVATAYRTDLGDTRAPNRRSLVSAGDILVDTEIEGGSLKLKWPNGDVYFAK